MKSTWLAVLTITTASLAVGCVDDGYAPGIEPAVEEPVDPCPPEQQTTYYADADGDGFGDAATAVSDCEAVVGYVPDNN